MSLAKVAKINIIAHKKYQPDILEALQDSGFIQIQDNKEESLEKINLNEKIAELDYKIAGARFSLEFLAKYDRTKKTLAEKINKDIILDPMQLQKIVDEFKFKETVEKVQELEKQINDAKNKIEKNRLEIIQLEPWKELNFAPDPKNLSTNFSFKLITTDPDLYSQLNTQLQTDLPLTEIQQISNEKNVIKAAIFFQKTAESKVIEILNKLNIKITELPELKITVDEKLKELNKILSEENSRVEKLEHEVSAMASQQENLKIISDYVAWQKEKLTNQAKLGNSWQTFSLIGWIEGAKIEKLEKELSRITNDFLIEKLSIEPEESAPIIFKNKLAEPFEMVTKLYGAPQSNEPDPTPFLAPFFTLFFGMAMTDAGYGLVLTVAAWLAIKIFKIPRYKQKLLRVLIWGGIATFILGALTGGWFGVELESLPAAIAGPLLAIQVINPVKNPLIIFYISLALGVIQVLTGLTINTVWKIKSGEAIDGLLGSGAWILTLVGLLTFAGGKMNLLSTPADIIGKWLALIGVGLIVYNGTRGTKNIFLKPGIGLLSLYGIVGYFSDVLSYSRLLALGLTTGIIGMVVNVIAGLTFNIPYIGWLLALIILIGGHLFNLVVNALGAFIHSSRLQFIEFFPKFIEAGGELFQPFCKESKYVRIVNK